MAFGQLSWVADLLLDDPDEKRKVVWVRVETCPYGTTSGPWGGIGGAAITEYTMTLIRLRGAHVIYADEKRMGKVKLEYTQEMMNRFPYVETKWIEETT